MVTVRSSIQFVFCWFFGKETGIDFQHVTLHRVKAAEPWSTLPTHDVLDPVCLANVKDWSFNHLVFGCSLGWFSILSDIKYLDLVMMFRLPWVFGQHLQQLQSDVFKPGSAISRAQRIAEHTGWEPICQYVCCIGRSFGKIDWPFACLCTTCHVYFYVSLHVSLYRNWKDLTRGLRKHERNLSNWLKRGKPDSDLRRGGHCFPGRESVRKIIKLLQTALLL